MMIGAIHRMASDRPGGDVLAAAFCRGAPSLPLVGDALRATAFLPGAFLVVAMEAGDSATTALVAAAFSETDFLLPSAERLLSPASFPLRPVADWRDDFFAARRFVDST